MPDSVYEQKMRRRQRWMWGIGGGLLGILLIFFVVRSFYYDNCTNSFDRTPQSVIRSYVNAVSAEDVSLAMNCWNKNDYLSLETGCSEICLQRLWGMPLQISGMQIGEAGSDTAGRGQIRLEIDAACPDGKTRERGEILLDTANMNIPWSHWKIIRSTFGGSIGEPWCR